MADSLRCTVVVPTFNRSDLLRCTLAALAAQTMPPDQFEVIVSDDGSSDDTRSVVAEFSARLDVQYLFQEDEGFRVARARNMALRRARGAVSVFVDTGVLMHSAGIESHCAVHERAQGPTAVVGYVWGFGDDTSQLARHIAPGDADGTISALAERNLYPDVREWYYARYGERLWTLAAPWLIYWTCNASADTATLREVGLFDENFRSWGGEDVDLAYRLHRRGARFELCRGAAAVHCPHPKSDTSRVSENHAYFAAKYDTPITRLRPGNDIFLIEQMISDQGLPSCTEYLSRTASRTPS